MLRGLLGTKLGMTQYFHEDGTVSAVTAVQAGPCTVTQVKTTSKDGYEAVQVGFGAVPPKRLNKPLLGHLRGQGPFRHLQEVPHTDIEGMEVGKVIAIGDIFQVGDRVRISGVSKGKGFAGVVKRHHFHGSPKTHGTNDRWRAPGSIGSTTTPGRVLKGRRMAGQMGNKKATVPNVKVVAVDPQRNLLFLKGSVPGAPASLVLVWKRGKA